MWDNNSKQQQMLLVDPVQTPFYVTWSSVIVHFTK